MCDGTAGCYDRTATLGGGDDPNWKCDARRFRSAGQTVLERMERHDAWRRCAGRCAGPGAASAAQGWQKAVDGWSKLVHGGREEANAAVERFNAQARSWYGQMQQVAAHFAGQDSNAADVAGAWKRAIGAIGENPFPEMFRAMRGQGAAGAGAMGRRRLALSRRLAPREHCVARHAGVRFRTASTRSAGRSWRRRSWTTSSMRAPTTR